MTSASRRPYLIRAIYDWALDNNYTPHLLVAADESGVEVPRSHVEDGHIALNVSPDAVKGFDVEAEPLFFSARFGGRPVDLCVPTRAVLAVYASETGEGIAFGAPEGGTPPPVPEDSTSKSSGGEGRPKLRVVK